MKYKHLGDLSIHSLWYFFHEYLFAKERKGTLPLFHDQSQF